MYNLERKEKIVTRTFSAVHVDVECAGVRPGWFHRKRFTWYWRDYQQRPNINRNGKKGTPQHQPRLGCGGHFYLFFPFFFVTLFVSVSGFVSQIAQALPIATLITTQHKGEEGKVVAGINLMNQNDPLFLDSVNFLSYLAFKTVAGCILTNI